MSNLVEIKVPDIGDFSDVDVIEVLVSMGDTVAVDDPLLHLEHDPRQVERRPRQELRLHPGGATRSLRRNLI